MSLLSRLLKPPPPALGRLWGWIVATARRPEWYLEHRVADSIDGRFDMVALVASLVMLELERRGRNREIVVLTERFVDDMDGSLRESGIGDPVIGKHVGRMVGALGGRLGVYREALAAGVDSDALAGALARNVYRGAAAAAAAPALAVAVRALAASIGAADDGALLRGDIR